MEIRMRFQNCKAALLHVPKDFTRKDIEAYVQSASYVGTREMVIKKLTEAKIKLSDLVRTQLKSTAAESIVRLSETER